MPEISDAILRQIFEKSAACMLMKADAPEFTIVTASDAYCALVGLSREQLCGKGAFSIFPDLPDDPSGANATRQAIMGAITSQKQTRIPEYSYHIADPKTNVICEFWWSSTFDPIMDEDGQVAYVLGTAIDLTENVRNRNALAAEKDRLKRFFMQAPAGICVLGGPELTFELINPLYQELFPGRALLGKPMLEAVPEVENTPIWEILQRVYQSGDTFEGNKLLIPLARTPDGPIEDRYFNFIYQARTDAAGITDGILVFVYEVTDIIGTELDLQKAQDVLRLAIEASAIGIWTVDLATDELILTARTRAIHGIPDDTKLTLSQSLEMIAEEYRQKVARSINEAVEHKKDFVEEYWLNPMDGGKRRWLRSNGRAFYDISGKPLYVTGAIFDFTEQKEDDIRKSDFIGMVSHELKTPLTSLQANIQVLAAKAAKQPGTFEATALAKSNGLVKKMGKMINGFLSISRLESGKLMIDKTNFVLNDLIQESIADVVLADKSHDIIFTPCHPVSLNADRDKIGSVINNLLNNAIKYSPKSRAIEVICKVTGDQVITSIRDSGIGIETKDLSKIFERYHRVQTGNTQHIAGFGIGLYLSAEIIHRHDGEIWAESEIGKGSTFYFTLPVIH